MTDIREIFGRSKNKYEIKGVKYLDDFSAEGGEDWSYYKPTDRPYRCIYVFEADEDEEDPQYKEKCFSCDTTLTINTPIMCYTKPDGKDFTLCSECYWEGKYYKDDINLDNEEEIKEWLEEEDEEDLEEEDAYWCVDCGKDFDWIKGKSYSGQGVNSYHCGICDKPKWAAHNKRYNLNEEEEEIEKCNICDIRLGMYDGKYEMKVVIDNMLDDGFKSYNCCGRCALDRVKRKTFERT